MQRASQNQVPLSKAQQEYLDLPGDLFIPDASLQNGAEEIVRPSTTYWQDVWA